MRLLFSFLRVFVQLLFIIFFRFRAFGTENLPRCGGMILASNHQSYLDPVIVGVPIRGYYHSLARSSLFTNPLFARLITFFRAIPIRQGTLDSKALRKGSGLVRQGKTLIVFPEGTRTRDGSIRKLRGGFVFLAKHAAAPIVPTVIWGAFEIWPRGRKVFRFGKLMIAFGKPVHVLPESNPPEVLREVEEAMWELKRNLDSLRDGS